MRGVVVDDLTTGTVESLRNIWTTKCPDTEYLI